MQKIIGLIVLTVVFISTGASSRTAHSTEFISSTETSEKEVVTGIFTRTNFEDSVQSLYNALDLERLGLKYDVFRYGLIGFQSLKHDGKLSDRNLVSFIDFTLNSTEKRFFTVDLDNRSVLFHSLVSHGRNTGENEAKYFSNTPNSNQSSLGFYVTGETYVGSKGYSLRLDGMDGTFNSKMRERAVVMHDAEYVSEEWIRKYGRLGRSQGCPALPKELARKVIDTIKDKTVIFAYYNDPQYLAASSHLNVDKLFSTLDQLEVATASLR